MFLLLRGFLATIWSEADLQFFFGHHRHFSILKKTISKQPVAVLILKELTPKLINSFDNGLRHHDRSAPFPSSFSRPFVGGVETDF